MISKKRIRDVIRLHTDPDDGSEFWKKRVETFRLNVGELMENPLAAPPTSAEELRDHPIEYFIPRKLLHEKRYLITGETSGFSGKPVVSVFTKEEFHDGFVDPFLSEANSTGFPVRGNWLWAGPSGPHIIGKAIREILHQVDGTDPFSVDFDPRWFKKLPANSMSATRYFNHVMEQIHEILRLQRVDVIFSTPPIIRALGLHLTEETRNKIRGVHYGGMSMTNDEYRDFREAFPNAVHMSGYGNSLFGMFPETGFDERGIEYAIRSNRIIAQAVCCDGETIIPCSIGEEGNVMFSRFDESMLILNMIEQDKAVCTETGLLNPHREQYQFEGKLLY